MLIESTRSYARELLIGISCFNLERKRWLIEFTPHGLDDMPPAWFRQWQGDGILARVNEPRVADAVRRKGCPVIDLRRRLRREAVRYGWEVPTVCTPLELMGDTEYDSGPDS